jgi:hypothetical protein
VGELLKPLDGGPGVWSSTLEARRAEAQLWVADNAIELQKHQH